MLLNNISSHFEAHMFGCENNTNFPIEAILDLSKTKQFSHMSHFRNSIIKKVVDPKSFSFLGQVRKHSGDDGDLAKLDIEFRHRKLIC